MSFQPIHRRYGYGAARLPIGMPLESDSLLESARTPTRLERSFAVAPGLLCASIAILLGGVAFLHSTTEDPNLALANPTTIDLELFSDPVRITRRPAAPIARPEAIQAKANPEFAKIAPPSPSSSAAPQDIQPEAVPTPFDPRVLVMAPTRSAPTEPNGTLDLAAAPRAQRRPTSHSATSTQSLAEIARSAPTARDFKASTADLGLGRASTSANTHQRPINPSAATANRDAPTWSEQSDRQAFLTALGKTAELGPASTRAAGSRPHIAAAAAANEIAREISGRVARQAKADGWHEVPLDELPDCSPPGRQDELKKRILLAAAHKRERECSHQDGHYRFLETRNLNAFLIWSRTNPDSPSRQRPARDVCDVLMSALRCLGDESMEDHE